MSAAAAEAAEVRMKANQMSVSELRTALAQKRVDTSRAVEKCDLVNLYIRSSKAPAPSTAPASSSSASNTPAAARSNRNAARTSQQKPTAPFKWPKLPEEVNWINCLIFFMVTLYIYKNFVSPSPELQSSSGKSDSSGGLPSNAYLDGKTVDIHTHGEFEAMIDKHTSDSGLPVIIDFHSRGCGPCRQIAPYFSALAKELQGQAVFAKVDVNKNGATSAHLGVRSMPTFAFFLNGKLRHRFSGADGRQLDNAARHLASEAQSFMGIGTFVNQEVTGRALMNFYSEHDPSKAELADGASVSLHVKETLEKYEGKTAALCRALQKKYSSIPTVSSRPIQLSPEEKAAAEAAIKAKAKADASALEGIRTEDLEKELALRRAEAAEKRDLFTPASTLPRGSVESIVVVGGGPAGLSAAIYAARAGLKPVVIAPSFGGQLLGKGVDVENYPGVVGIDATGRGIIELMRQQAVSFDVRLVPETVVNVIPRSRRSSKTRGRNEFELVLNDTEKSSVRTSTIILATGAASRWLGVEGEYEFRGSGVSTCATCDGFLYRDKDVIVVGGGDTAMEDALVLARTSSKVTIVHRRGAFRASYALAQRVLVHEKIQVLWNATVLRFDGSAGNGQDPGGLESVSVRVAGVKGGSEDIVLPCAAAFVAIGHDPVTDFVKETSIKKDQNGYVLTGRDVASGSHEHTFSTSTSVEGIFAAGDVSDHLYRQAITSAGSGAMAALDAERYLSSDM